MYTRGHTSIIPNSQKAETAQRPIKGRVNQQIRPGKNEVQMHEVVMHEVLVHATMWMKPQGITLSERSQTRDGTNDPFI